MNPYSTVGLSALPAAAIFEAALIPGIVIAGAAVLAPKYLPELRRRLQPGFDAIIRTRSNPRFPRRPRGTSTRHSPSRPNSRRRKGRSGRVYDQSGVGQDHNLSDHRHSGRLHHELCGGRRHRHGWRSVRRRFVVGPFVYFGHERVWDYFSTPRQHRQDALPPPDRMPVIVLRRRLADLSEA
jgi:hypothetical protein